MSAFHISVPSFVKAASGDIADPLLDESGGSSPRLSARKLVVLFFSPRASAFHVNLVHAACYTEWVWNGVPSVWRTVSEYMMYFHIRRWRLTQPASSFDPAGVRAKRANLSLSLSVNES